MAKPHAITICLILGIIGVILGLELDDPCDASRYPSSSNPIEYDSYTKCDPRQGLFCNTQTSRCSCYVVDSEYDHYYDTCRGKIGFPCKASPSFSISCGENAYCEEPHGFCKCEEDYKADPNDKFNCNSGLNLAGSLSTFAVFLVSMFIFKVWIF